MRPKKAVSKLYEIVDIINIKRGVEMFHVSKRDLGHILTLTPQIPRSAGNDECLITPRVCFSPTVEQCVIGIVGYGVSHDITFLAAFSVLANAGWCPTVYYTDEDLIEPDRVSDFHITQEHWALDPVKVERIGYIDCMAMLKHKRIDIVDTPKYVSCAEQELAYCICDKDRKLLLTALQ
jgi:hypothetical protein